MKGRQKIQWKQADRRKDGADYGTLGLPELRPKQPQRKRPRSLDWRTCEQIASLDKSGITMSGNETMP